jgi:hypothetical protein
MKVRISIDTLGKQITDKEFSFILDELKEKIAIVNLDDGSIKAGDSYIVFYQNKLLAYISIDSKLS